MKKHLFNFLFLPSFVASVSAQKPYDVESKIYEKHVEYVASDKL